VAKRDVLDQDGDLMNRATYPHGAVTFALAIVLGACGSGGSATRPLPAPPAPRSVEADRANPPRDEEWVDLDELSVEIHTARVRARARTGARQDDAITGEEVVVTPTGDGLVGVDRDTRAARWNVRSAANGLLAHYAADRALKTPEVVMAVDTRASLPNGSHRELVAWEMRSGHRSFQYPLPDDDPPTRTSMPEPRILIIEGRASTTVIDVMLALVEPNSGRPALGGAQTFHEAVRWVGGYTWSSGDLIVSSDRRVARVEFTSTDREHVGSVVWSVPPLAGSRGEGILTGGLDESPNEVAKAVVLAGFDPSADSPVELEMVEALGRSQWRSHVAPVGVAGGDREVRLLDRGAEILAVVASARGAVVERRTLATGALVSRVGP
jgi:hypothetical protein